jgi:hypothetical protein
MTNLKSVYERTLWFVSAVAVVTVGGCSDSATAPNQRVAPPVHSLLSSPTTVGVLQRTTPLASPLTVSAVIGALGGQLSIPQAGLTVVVPPLAVLHSTTFTVTALAGSAVAYEFGPEGKHFLVPLVVTQDLGATQTSGLNLLGLGAAYFKNAADINPLTGTASVFELLNISLNPTGQSLTFLVTHFSGYLATSGVEPEEEPHGQ